MSFWQPAATTPSLSAVCDFEQTLCGWSADPQSGVSWSLHTASSSSTGHGTHGTRQDLALGSDSEYRIVVTHHNHTEHPIMKCVKAQQLQFARNVNYLVVFPQCQSQCLPSIDLSGLEISTGNVFCFFSLRGNHVLFEWLPCQQHSSTNNITIMTHFYWSRGLVTNLKGNSGHLEDVMAEFDLSL